MRRSYSRVLPGPTWQARRRPSQWGNVNTKATPALSVATAGTKVNNSQQPSAHDLTTSKRAEHGCRLGLKGEAPVCRTAVTHRWLLYLLLQFIAVLQKRTNANAAQLRAGVVDGPGWLAGSQQRGRVGTAAGTAQRARARRRGGARTLYVPTPACGMRHVVVRAARAPRRVAPSQQAAWPCVRGWVPYLGGGGMCRSMQVQHIHDEDVGII